MMNKLLFAAILLVLFATITSGQKKFCKTANRKLDQLITLFNDKDCDCQGSGPSGPTSCKEIYDNNLAQGNKAYMLQMDTGKIPVYCHMTDSGIGSECGGGGWTLVMKTDGTKSTFHYDSSYWSDKKEYGIPEGGSGFDEEEAKLPTYWNTPFSKICLGMKVPGEDIRFLVLEISSSSLYALIADGKYRSTALGRNTWKTLIGAQSSLQLNCNKEGFNVASGDKSSSKVRIGYMANQENECISGDSRIGFGAGGHQDNTNTCGNEATHSADNGDKHIKAMGYILVQ